MSSTGGRVSEYIRNWQTKGYADDIPDECPNDLERAGVVPSYRQLALCLLNNDVYLHKLGGRKSISKWYGFFKRIELEERERETRTGVRVRRESSNFNIF